MRLGEHDLSTTTETNHVDINVAKTISHPNYDSKDGHSDLAVLVLDKDISFTCKVEKKVWLIHKSKILALISPICIPINEQEKSKNLVGFTPFIAGKLKTK